MKIMQDVENKMESLKKRIVDIACFNAKNLTILFAIYLLAFCAIVRADYNYADDIMRKYIGYHGWMDWTRWTTTILSNVVHADWDLIDVSPFPQILACLFLAITSLSLIKAFSDSNNISFMNLVASTAVGLCPYFLGCIAFKYDAPYMALSMLVSIIPFLFVNEGKVKYAIVSFFGVLVMITSYQTSSGIYPTMVMFIAVDMYCRKDSLRKIVNFILISAVMYILAIAFFAFVLLQPGETETFPLNSIISGIISRYIYIGGLVLTDFRKLWIFFIGIAIAGYIMSVYFESQNNKIISVFLAFLSVLLGSIFAWNVLLIMSRETVDARNMIGIGPLIAIIFIKLSSSSKATLFKISFIVVNWCWFVYAFAFGNSLKEQQRYTDFRIQILIEDLNLLEYNDNTNKYLAVEGSIGFSPVIDQMNEHYNYLRKLLNYNILGQSTLVYAEGFYLYNYFGLNSEYSYDLQTDFAELELPVVIDNMYETIYSNGTYVYVVLKECDSTKYYQY